MLLPVFLWGTLEAWRRSSNAVQHVHGETYKAGVVPSEARREKTGRDRVASIAFCGLPRRCRAEQDARTDSKSGIRERLIDTRERVHGRACVRRFVRTGTASAARCPDHKRRARDTRTTRTRCEG
jgi:hypothetical protein